MKALLLPLLMLVTSFLVAADIPTQTPLEKKYHHAAYVGDLDTLRQCIREGVDVNCQDPYGNTAMMHAVVYRKDKILDFLLLICSDVNRQTNRGTTALMMAAQTQNKPAVYKLVDAGANTSLRNFQQKTAYDLAKGSKDKSLENYLQAAEKTAR
ncbi:MAG: ankyrin repeat domain-containing protein [Akkermansia sp.]